MDDSCTAVVKPSKGFPSSSSRFSTLLFSSFLFLVLYPSLLCSFLCCLTTAPCHWLFVAESRLFTVPCAHKGCLVCSDAFQLSWSGAKDSWCENDAGRGRRVYWKDNKPSSSSSCIALSRDVVAPLGMESNDGRGPITVAITFQLAVCGPRARPSDVLVHKQKNCSC